MTAARLKTAVVLAMLLAVLAWGGAAVAGARLSAAAKWTLGLPVALYFAYCLSTAALWIRVLAAHKRRIACCGEDILIVAPHQDDCVAIAGGYAIQTRSRGGRVTVLFATDGSADDKETRKREAQEAWSLIGVGGADIRFLQYDNNRSLVTGEELGRLASDLSQVLEEIRPKTVFVPLYEGGNYQHDAVNYAMREAVRRTGFKGRVFEAPEYNFFLSFRTTPEKILSGLMRFVPFARHDYPPEPVLPDPVLHLAMTSEELRIKREMLSRFATQQPEQLVVRFGFEDRYQVLHDHDYARPPFDYERSLAKRLDRLKALPLVGFWFRRMFKWTRTIHPDTSTEITRLPLIPAP
jgi:LmbE family N-acetylglucosaminyl deacetylase